MHNKIVKSRRSLKRLASFLLMLSMVFTLWNPGIYTVKADVNTQSGDYLTLEGAPEAQIVLSDDATLMEEYAAEELRDHIELVSGAKLPIVHKSFDGTEFSSTVNLASIETFEKGYYPFEISLDNPTDKDMQITLSQINAIQGMPTVLIRGDEGLAEGQVEVSKNSNVVVSGLIKVENPDAFGRYEVKITAHDENDVILASHEITLFANGNYLSGSNFESGTTSWQNGNIDASAGYSDVSYSAVNPAYGENLYLGSGNLYLLKFWAKSDGVNTANVRLRDFDSNGGALTTSMSLNNRIELSNGWSYYEFRFVSNMSGDASYAYSVLDFTGNATVWLDEIALLNCGAASSSIADNGDMEEYVNSDTYGYYFNPWVLDNRAYVTLEQSTDKWTGSYSAAVTIAAGYTDSPGRYAGDMTRAKTNTTYTLSFWAKATNNDATVRPDAYMWVDGQMVNAANIPTFTLTSEWERYEFTFETVENCSTWGGCNVNMELFCTASNMPTTIYLDSISIIATDSADERGGMIGKPRCDLVSNGSIESSDYWTGGFVVEDGYSGTAYQADASANPGYDDELMMGTGRLYLLGFWAKTDGAGANVNVCVSDYDSSGNILSVPDSLNSKLALTEEWNYYEFRFKANTGNLSAYAWSKLGFTGTGNIWLDEVLLLDCGTSPEILTSAYDMANADYAEVDGAYQFGPWRFDNRNWNELEVDTSTYYTGDTSALLKMSSGYNEGHGNTNPSDYFNGILLQGGTYTLSFWAKSSSEGNTLKPYITESDKATEGNTIFTLTQQWERYEMTFTMNASRAAVPYFNIKFGGTDTSGVSYWLDNFYIIDTAAANTIKDLPAASEDAVTDDTPMPAQPQIPAPMANDFNIVIATPDSYPALATMFAEDIEYLKDSDGFAIRQNGNTVYIFGTETGGALNGVYDFLEENLGIIWLRVTDTAYQPNDTVTVTKVDYREKSPFEIRGWHLAGSSETLEGYYTPTQRLVARNKINTIGIANPAKGKDTPGLEPMNISHNAIELVLESPLYDPNEDEYWCTDSEGNQYEYYLDPFKSQINYWSEKTSDAVAASLIQRVKESGNDYIFFGVEDGAYTTCLPWSEQPIELEDGTKVYPDEDDYMSTVIFTFVNRVAKKLKQECPDVTLATFAYWICQEAPRCEIEDNVCIVIAPIEENMKLPINTTEEDAGNNQAFEDIEAWKEKTTNLAFYNYYGCYIVSGYYERPVAASRIQKDLQYYAESGFTGIIPEGVNDKDYTPATPWQSGSDTWSMNSLTFWLYAKLTWNPYEDVDALTRQFCNAVYGDAADAMYQYYKLMEQGWIEGGNDPEDPDFPYTTKLINYLEQFIVEPGLEDAIRAALNEAWTLADETAKSRIKYIKDTFELNMRNYSKVEVEDGTALYTTAGKEKILETFDYTDEVWADAIALENFCDNQSGQFISEMETTVRLLWDEEYLYVGYWNYDKTMDDLVSTDQYSDSSSSWWATSSDDVETFVTIYPNAGNAQGDSPYYAYFANPDGLNFRYGKIDGTTTYLSDKVGYEVVVRQFDEAGDYNDRWVVIQAIPFASLGLEGNADANTQLYGYFYRQYYTITDGAAKDNQISWNAAAVWEPKYLREIKLLTEVHKECTYTAEVPDEKYLKSAATCTGQAVYYKSCECGKSSEGQDGEATFTYGKLVDHKYSTYVSNGDATGEKDGTKTAECDYGCGTTDTVTDSGSKLPHTQNVVTGEVKTETQTDNVAEPTQDATTSPKTGDSSHIMLSITMMVVSLLTIAVLVVFRKKNSYSGKDIRE